MIEVTCVSTGDLEFISTSPFTRNKRGMLVQKPAFTIKSDDNFYHFHGRDVMWAFLDALFPDDCLPRNALEDDLYAPDEFSDSMYTIFKDLVAEAYDEGNDYLILRHENFKVRMVTSLKSLGLSDEIEKAGADLQRLGCVVDYHPFKYRDKRSTHLRRAVYSYINKCMVEVVDLGKRWYVRSVAPADDGSYVALSLPIAVGKDADLLPVLSDLIELANSHRAWEVKPLKPPVNNSASLLSREYDVLLYERKMTLAL